MSKKVLISTSSFAEHDSSALQLLRRQGYEVRLNPHRRRLTKTEIISLLNGVDGLIAGLEPLDRDVLGRSRLTVISRLGAGLSNVDLDYASEKGIRVYSTPEAPIEAVAELTVGALLSLFRHIPVMDSAMHHKKWDRRLGRQLFGKTVLIVGYGRIGRRVASLLEAFRVRLLICDPKVTSLAGNLEKVELDVGLRQADVVTLHCDGESLLLNDTRIARMKEGAYLLNVARGDLVDEKALLNAVREGHLAGAWMDTFSEEPYRGALAGNENILLTPHAGSYTMECRKAMEHEAVVNLIDGFSTGSSASGT